jgi:hypothetical protein
LKQEKRRDGNCNEICNIVNFDFENIAKEEKEKDIEKRERNVRKKEEKKKGFWCGERGLKMGRKKRR